MRVNTIFPPKIRDRSRIYFTSIFWPKHESNNYLQCIKTALEIHPEKNSWAWWQLNRPFNKTSWVVEQTIYKRLDSPLLHNRYMVEYSSVWLTENTFQSALKFYPALSKTLISDWMKTTMYARSASVLKVSLSVSVLCCRCNKESETEQV